MRTLEVIDGTLRTHYSSRRLFDELTGGKLGAYISSIGDGSGSSDHSRLALFDQRPKQYPPLAESGENRRYLVP